MDRALLAKVPGSPQGPGGLAASDPGQKPDKGVVVQMLRRLLQVESPGFITDHLREILRLPPEVSRIDQTTFVATIDATGAVTNPGNIRLDPDYEHELFAILGWVQNPGTAFAGVPYVSFNIREQGRNFDLFNNDARMATYVTTAGVASQLEYPRGSYVFRPGADVQVRFQVTNAAAYAAVAEQEEKLYGVVLLTNMARKK